MPTAILKIDGDTSGLSRAFGDLRAQAKATENAIKSSMTAAFGASEKAAQRAEGSYRRSGRVARDESSRTAVASERDAHRAVAAYVRGEEQKRRAAQQSASVRAALEKQATQIASDEARKRGLSADAEARVRQGALERLTKSYEAAERRNTATLKREQRERDGIIRTVGRGVSTVANAGAGFAQDAHQRLQDARRSRAQGERVLGQAARNAGWSEQDVAYANREVRAFSERTGIAYGDVAQALSIGQQRGSSLQADRGETNADALRRALALVREANAEGADPGQYLAARGRLAAVGLRGNALQGAMRFSLGAAQAGQVEVDQIIGAGLPGASRLMAQRAGAVRRNQGETDAAFEERKQQAMLGAWRESVATQEVLAASGSGAGRTSNTLASLQGFLSTPRRQEMALTNIKAAESQINTSTPEGRARAAQLRSLYEGENALFERDPTRRGDAMRLREGASPIEFATRVASAFGGDSQAASRIFAGGGHGNAQAFLVNMRDLMSVLGGERGNAVREMMGGEGVSQEQIDRHQNAVENDSLAQLTRAEEQGTNALTNNTAAVNNLSNRVNDWLAAHPVEGAGLKAAAPVLGAVASWGAKELLTSTVGMVGGAALNTLGATVNSARTAVTGKDLDGNDVGLGRRAASLAGTVLTPLAIGETGRQIGDAIGARIVAAFRENPPTATVSPVDATHAAAQAPVAR